MCSVSRRSEGREAKTKGGREGSGVICPPQTGHLTRDEDGGGRGGVVSPDVLFLWEEEETGGSEGVTHQQDRTRWYTKDRDERESKTKGGIKATGFPVGIYVSPSLPTTTLFWGNRIAMTSSPLHHGTTTNKGVHGLSVRCPRSPTAKQPSIGVLLGPPRGGGVGVVVARVSMCPVSGYAPSAAGKTKTSGQWTMTGNGTDGW